MSDSQIKTKKTICILIHGVSQCIFENLRCLEDIDFEKNIRFALRIKNNLSKMAAVRKLVGGF